MTRFKTAASSLHIALLLVAIAPAPLFAESSVTARQLLAQAQTQSEARQANGAFKRIARNLSPAEAPVLASSEPSKPAVATVAAPPPVAPQAEIDAPTVTRGHEATDVAQPAPETKPSEPTALPETKTETAVTPPLPGQSAKVEAPQPLPVQTARVEAPAAVVAQPAKVIAPPPVAKPEVTVATAAPVTTATAAAAPVAVAKPSAPVVATATTAPKVEKAPAPAPLRKVANADTTKTPHAKAASPQRYGSDADAAAIRGQIQHIINRPEVRAIMAQYGLQ